MGNTNFMKPSRAVEQLSAMLQSLVGGLVAAFERNERATLLQAGRQSSVLTELAEQLRHESLRGVSAMDMPGRLALLEVADLACRFAQSLEVIGWRASSMSDDFAKDRILLGQFCLCLFDRLDGSTRVGSALYSGPEERDVPRKLGELTEKLTSPLSLAEVQAMIHLMRGLEELDTLFQLIGDLRRLEARLVPAVRR